MRQQVETGGAPAALGPYSQGIKAGSFVFAAGQLGLDPASGNLVDGGVAEQTDRALRNVTAILDAAGASLERVVKTTVFLAEMDDFAAMNEVYARHFSAPFPARSTVAVKTLPKGALVEVEAIAVAGDGA
jgi:2-iminobutanoate/2-iminopropanoate deaminase